MHAGGERLAEFEALIGLRFKDQELLWQALTHSSFVNENTGIGQLRDNERLEFLGDAVLDYIVASLLYRRYPKAGEGQLTQLRAALVKTESLAHIARDFRLGEFLRIGHGEERGGGRERLSALCCGLEAVIGAVYLDQGLDAAISFLKPSLLRLLDSVIANRSHIDARSELQERIQARLNRPPAYKLVDAQGPEHEKEFRVEVSLGQLVIGSGRGRSKRLAAQAAAAAALRRLDANELPEAIWQQQPG